MKAASGFLLGGAQLEHQLVAAQRLPPQLVQAPPQLAHPAPPHAAFLQDARPALGQDVRLAVQGRRYNRFPIARVNQIRPLHDARRPKSLGNQIELRKSG